MSPGDWVTIHMHDTPAGFRIDLTDETTHQSGSMTASVDNGFAHVLFTPDASECTVGAVRVPSRVQHRQPAGEHVVGAHLQRRVLRRDRPLRALQRRSTRTSTARRGLRRRDARRRRRLLCAGLGFTARPHQRLLRRRRRLRRAFVPEGLAGNEPRRRRPTSGCTPSRCCSPARRRTAGTTTPTIAFEADLPAIERLLQRATGTGAGCMNPPPGSQFYPFYSTRKVDGTCAWQEGGRFIPGTIRDFGGSSATEYGRHCCRRSSRRRGSPR